jgi:hypothetical protein
MADAGQGGNHLDPSQGMERRPSERLIIESKKLYGFRVSDAVLEVCFGPFLSYGANTDRAVTRGPIGYSHL